MSQNGNLIRGLGEFISRLFSGRVPQIAAIILQNLVARPQTGVISQRIRLDGMDENPDRVTPDQRNTQIRSLESLDVQISRLFLAPRRAALPLQIRRLLLAAIQSILPG